MTPYHKIMQSLVAHGYVHEWKFGDRAFCTITNKEVVVFSTSGKVSKVLFQYDGFGLAKIDALIPLPTVDQWMEKLWSYNLTIESGHGSGYLCRWNNRGRDNPSTYDDDIRIALAILYARITLNLKWNEEKGEFEAILIKLLEESK